MSSLWVLPTGDIVGFFEHDVIPVQLSAIHSGHPNPGMFLYFPCHILMLVAVARLEGTAWSQTLQDSGYSHPPGENGVQALSFRHPAVYLVQWQSLHFHFTVLFFLEDCLNSSCRSCLLCAWAVTCFPELSCLCVSGFSLAKMRFTMLKTELSFVNSKFPCAVGQVVCACSVPCVVTTCSSPWIQVFLCQVRGKLQAEFLSVRCLPLFGRRKIQKVC